MTNPNFIKAPRRARKGGLSHGKEIELARHWREKKDQAALNTLISAHINLVQKIAREYRTYGVDMDDIVSEGMIGLIKAGQHFDPHKGARLTTYAAYWIRTAILEYVVRNRGSVSISKARSAYRACFGLRRAFRALERDGIETTSKALAAQLKVSEGTVIGILQALNSSGPHKPLELPATLTNGESLYSDAEVADQQKTALREALALLHPREREIITARYLQEKPATLAALGEHYGVTKERIRQLEKESRQKLEKYVNQVAPTSPSRRATG